MTMMSLARVGLALGLLGAALGASSASERIQLAQSYRAGCVLDKCGDKRDPAPAEPSYQPRNRREYRDYSQPRDNSRDYSQPRYNDDGPRDYNRGGYRPRGGGGRGTAGEFDFYVLALSWSSGFCETGGDDKGKAQCAPGAGLGFVVHGLWPQYERGYPSDCSISGGGPTRMQLDSVRGLFPDEGLARYEWRKHGTCSGKNPAEYFADVRAARNAIQIPTAFEKPRSEQNISPNALMNAFQEANPRLRAGMMAVGCKRGVLQEVRICLSKDLREFRSCPEVSRQSCRGQDLSVPPVR